MTVGLRSAALMIATGLALLVAAPMGALGQKPRAERPTYTLGDRWIRSDGIFDLIRIDGDGYVFATEDGREIYLTKDLVAVRATRRGELEWALDPWPELSWPLEVGKWGTRSSVTRPNSFTPSRLTWRIEAFEEIRVPAGRFKAFRVGIDFGIGRITQWYAPDAKQVIKAVAGFGGLSYTNSPTRFPNFEVLAVDGLPADGVASTRTKPSIPEPGARRSPPAEAPTMPAREAVEILISSPTDQARVEHDSITLAGVVSGDRGLARVIVTLNGADISRIEERTPARSVALGAALKLVEGPNTLVVTAVTASGFVHQTIRTVHYERPAPLSIAIRYPADGTRVSEESSVVVAVVSSGRGIDRITVTLNGTEVHQQQEKGRPKSVVVTVPVKLRDGANAVVVSAAAADGQMAQELRGLVLERPAGASTAGAVQTPLKLAPARDRWAVIIGVGRYESDSIPKLQYAVADAEAIYQILIGSGGFKKEHVLLLTDKTERKPTLRTIRWALGTFLSRSAKKDDTVLIFFAGHGAPEIDPRGVERDGLAKYLIPIDADPDDLYSSAFPMDELQTVFGRIEAERVVAFLDACYSGTAGGRTFSSKKTRTGSADDVFLERLTRSRGRAIITASRPSEVSLELPELGHGLFTYYLLQGLKGGGDLNRDGIVSLQELYEYVEQQVVGKSRAVGGNQHPIMKGEMEGTLPLIRVGPRRE